MHSKCEKLTKKYVLTKSFSAIEHLQKEPITTSSENVPDSQSLAYRRNIIYSVKTSDFSYSNTYKHYLIVSNQFFLNIWNHGKNIQDLHGQNYCKKNLSIFTMTMFLD